MDESSANVILVFLSAWILNEVCIKALDKMQACLLVPTLGGHIWFRPSITIKWFKMGKTSYRWKLWDCLKFYTTIKFIDCPVSIIFGVDQTKMISLLSSSVTTASYSHLYISLFIAFVSCVSPIKRYCLNETISFLLWEKKVPTNAVLKQLLYSHIERLKSFFYLSHSIPWCLNMNTLIYSNYWGHYFCNILQFLFVYACVVFSWEGQEMCICKTGS